jgi:hypothetical protein
MITLTGGDLGGIEIDDPTWTEGEIRIFDGLQYRRQGSVAVFCGVA